MVTMTVAESAGAGDSEDGEEDNVTAKAATRQFKRALFLARVQLIGWEQTND